MGTASCRSSAARFMQRSSTKWIQPGRGPSRGIASFRSTWSETSRWPALWVVTSVVFVLDVVSDHCLGVLGRMFLLLWEHVLGGSYLAFTSASPRVRRRRRPRGRGSCRRRRRGSSRRRRRGGAAGRRGMLGAQHGLRCADDVVLLREPHRVDDDVVVHVATGIRRGIAAGLGRRRRPCGTSPRTTSGRWRGRRARRRCR